MGLIDSLKSEWPFVKSAPFAAASIFALGAAIAWGISSFVMSERLKLRDEQIAQLKERLDQRPALGNEFAKHSNQDLKEEALRLVSDLRRSLEGYRSQTAKLRSDYDERSRNAKTKQEEGSLWAAAGNAESEVTGDLLQLYDRSYKVRAKLLRDELLRRAPRAQTLDGHSWERFNSIRYDHPTNPLGLTAVADHLEQLARSL